MPTLLIGYDLNKPGQNYEPLWDKLKSYGTWWHHLDSTWLIRTNLSATQLRDALAPLIDSSDELLVIDVSGRSWAGRGFSDRAFQWLHDNL
jgi:hypothetical protein